MKRLTFACTLQALCLVLAAPVFAQQGGGATTPATGTRPAAAKPKPAAATPTGDAKSAKPSATTSNAPGGGQANLVATFTDWSTYTAQTGRAKICYALSLPKARQPANLKDTPAYLFVSFRPADNVKNEVAAVLGFPTKESGPADAAIGPTTYALVTKGANAWVKNPAEEAQVIASMSKGKEVLVSVTSARGNKTTDRYSLSGFAQALDRAKKECP
jgi:hypothetical protein